VDSTEHILCSQCRHQPVDILSKCSILSLYANTLYHPRLVLCRLDHRNIPNSHGNCWTFSLGQSFEQETSRKNQTTFVRRQRIWIRIIANSFANLNCSLSDYSLYFSLVSGVYMRQQQIYKPSLTFKKGQNLCNVLKSFSLNLLHLDVNHLPSRIYNVVWQRIILSSL